MTIKRFNEREHNANVAARRPRRIVEARRIQPFDDPTSPGAVRVSYLAHETRFLTRQQAEREPEVWALCTWWH